MKRIIILIAMTSLLFSCKQEEPLPKAPEWQEVDIGANVLPLHLRIPEGEEIHMHSHWNETFGRLELSGKENDEIFIQESQTTCADKKKELAGSIFEVSFLEDSDSLLIYRTSVPGSEESYWNIFALLTDKHANYIAEQNPLIAYDQEEILRISDIIKRIKAN